MTFPAPANLTIPGRRRSEYYGFADDFVSGSLGTNADTTDWLLSGTSAAVAFLDDRKGGWIRLTTNTTNPAQIERNGEAFRYDREPGVLVTAEAVVRVNDVDATRAFIGHALAAGSDLGTTLPAHCVGFVVTATGAIQTVVRKGSVGSAQNTGKTFSTDGEEHRLCWHYDGNFVRFFVDGAQVAAVNENIPDTEVLTLHIGLTGTAASETLDVDYVDSWQKRT